jgi:ACS family hexuronate transporter-like MFS transporter
VTSTAFEFDGEKLGRRRWLICALLFFAATVNYMDRQVIGLLKPVLQHDLGWTEIGYSNIVFAFQAAYAIGLVVVGRLMDWLGTRKGFSLAVLVWSAAAMAHAAARSVLQFAIARFALGLGEAGNFPASIKTVAEWFPKRERALATGIFNSGTNIGAVLTPLFVPWLTYRYGWRMSFIVTGAIGLLWLTAWLIFYRAPENDARLSPKELAYIRSDPGEPEHSLRWAKIVRHRQAWAIAAGRFLTDPIWYIYLFWVPDFLHRNLGLDLKAMALPLFVIYNGATLGSIFGGGLSSYFLHRLFSLNASRKAALLVCALATVPVIFASQTRNVWLVVALVAVAAGAHQGWSANMYTLASDMFPRSAVGSVVGFASMVGSVGGMFAAKGVGYTLQWTHSYTPVFAIAGSVYVLAFLTVQVLAPKIEPVAIGQAPPN